MCYFIAHEHSITVASNANTAQTINTGVTATVSGTKSVGLKFSNIDEGATVQVSPAAQTLVAGTTAYQFNVTATAENGATNTCVITVNFTSVTA